MIYLKTFETYDKRILSYELLKFASKHTSLQKMRDLIKAGADVNIMNNDGKCPLINATIALFYSGIKLLIDNGANLDITDHVGDTAFLILSKYPKYTSFKYDNTIKKIIDLFISNDADMNICDNDGYDIFDHFSEKFINHIKDNHTEQYNNYLIKKESENYNL